MADLVYDSFIIDPLDHIGWFSWEPPTSVFFLMNQWDFKTSTGRLHKSHQPKSRHPHPMLSQILFHSSYFNHISSTHGFFGASNKNNGAEHSHPPARHAPPRQDAKAQLCVAQTMYQASRDVALELIPETVKTCHARLDFDAGWGLTTQRAKSVEYQP